MHKTKLNIKFKTFLRAGHSPANLVRTRVCVCVRH